MSFFKHYFLLLLWFQQIVSSSSWRKQTPIYHAKERPNIVNFQTSYKAIWCSTLNKLTACQLKQKQSQQNLQLKIMNKHYMLWVRKLWNVCLAVHLFRRFKNKRFAEYQTFFFKLNFCNIDRIDRMKLVL